MQQKIEEMEERMQQRMHEKLNEQKDVMEQNITMNVIARLQRLNSDLRLDPDMLRFNSRSLIDASSVQQAAIQLNNRPSAGSNNQDLLKSSKPYVEALKALPSVLSFSWELDAFVKDFVC
ncbi:uncharacterized protein LOC107816415 isoform X2 [Nicotiana tabacum]|uniref:Uncharacterized protein LOC107816415 isoform X2 n=1 Tax=Nicotiana tabacum TaxID=4097 RepID=A0AC58S2A5_TOBAC